MFKKKKLTKSEASKNSGITLLHIESHILRGTLFGNSTRPPSKTPDRSMSVYRSPNSSSSTSEFVERGTRPLPSAPQKPVLTSQEILPNRQGKRLKSGNKRKSYQIRKNPGSFTQVERKKKAKK
jgi:hypothetical protein